MRPPHAALCVLIVPVAILAPHWNKLLTASVLPPLAVPGLPDCRTWTAVATFVRLPYLDCRTWTAGLP